MPLPASQFAVYMPVNKNGMTSQVHNKRFRITVPFIHHQSKQSYVSANLKKSPSKQSWDKNMKERQPKNTTFLAYLLFHREVSYVAVAHTTCVYVVWLCYSQFQS